MQTAQMNVLQVFRAVLTLVAAPGNPKFALEATPDVHEGTPSQSDHAALSPCVALDSSQCFNVLCGVPGCAWRIVQAAATSTLAALSESMGLSGATIGTLFYPSRCPALVYDTVLRVEVPPVATGDLFAADAPWSACAANCAQGLLQKALSDRILEVAVVQKSVAGAVVSSKGEFSALPGVSSPAGLLVGTILNPSEVRTVSICT